MDKIKLFIKNLLKVIAVFFIYFISINLFTIILKKFKLDNHPNICSSIIYLFSAIILFIIFRKDLISSFKDFKENYKKYLKKGFKIYLICLLITYVSNIIIYKYMGNIVATNEQLNRDIINTNLVFAIYLMCIMAPFEEEILFRLNFKKLFNNKIVFSILTGILFGSMHIISAGTKELIFLLPYSFLGIGLGYIYYDTDNIYTSMFFHFFNNAFSILILLLAEII